MQPRDVNSMHVLGVCRGGERGMGRVCRMVPRGGFIEKATPEIEKEGTTERRGGSILPLLTS